MFTVVETRNYLAAADDAGMTDDEREAAVDLLALTPDAGDVMVGAGGCRKVRLAGNQASLSKAERSALAIAAKGLDQL